MADKEKYLIKIQGKLIEVSEDVYYAYFHMERQERTQEEKKQRNEVMSYDALDNGDTVGMRILRMCLLPAWRNKLLQRRCMKDCIMLLRLSPEVRES